MNYPVRFWPGGPFQDLGAGETAKLYYHHTTEGNPIVIGETQPIHIGDDPPPLPPDFIFVGVDFPSLLVVKGEVRDSTYTGVDGFPCIKWSYKRIRSGVLMESESGRSNLGEFVFRSSS